MTYKYVVCTSITKYFDPEVEGLTIDSIAHTCPGYVKHSIPRTNSVDIHITLDRPIEGEPERWLIGQLEAEFEEGARTIVLGIEEDRG